MKTQISRRDFLRQSIVTGSLMWASTGADYGRTDRANKMETRWIQPGKDSAPPIWGIPGGIQVGLWPGSVEGPGPGGPRGLLRIGYPILEGGKHIGLINFMAVEPIVKGQRGFSELEKSGKDGQPGRLFWTGGKAQANTPADPGTIRTTNGKEYLSVRVHTEPFDNGAQPIVDLEFRADRPGEVRLTVSSAPGSARMDQCVLTATMGNYARLRNLWLRDGVIHAKELWPDFTGSEFSSEMFFPHSRFPQMPEGDLVVCATSDETDPHAVPPDPVAPGWAYRGSFPVTQYWRKPKDSDKTGLRVRVNGRRVYWASHNPIPGGLAYENFDLTEPFREGQTSLFGLTRSSPAEVVRGIIH